MLAQGQVKRLYFKMETKVIYSNKWFVFYLSLIIAFIFLILFILIISEKLVPISCYNIIQGEGNCSGWEIAILKWGLGIGFALLITCAVKVFFQKEKLVKGYITSYWG